MKDICVIEVLQLLLLHGNNIFITTTEAVSLGFCGNDSGSKLGHGQANAALCVDILDDRKRFSRETESNRRPKDVW